MSHAATFRDLHRSGLLILANAWDAASAALATAAAYGTADGLTRGFLADGRSEPQIAAAMDYGTLNALMARSG